MYELAYTRKATKKLRRLDATTRRRIIQVINEVAQRGTDAQADIKKLQDRPEYRLRIGDWRVFFTLDEQTRQMAVKIIDNRGQVYR